METKKLAVLVKVSNQLLDIGNPTGGTFILPKRYAELIKLLRGIKPNKKAKVRQCQARKAYAKMVRGQ